MVQYACVLLHLPYPIHELLIRQNQQSGVKQVDERAIWSMLHYGPSFDGDFFAFYGHLFLVLHSSHQINDISGAQVFWC